MLSRKTAKASKQTQVVSSFVVRGGTLIRLFVIYNIILCGAAAFDWSCTTLLCSSQYSRPSSCIIIYIPSFVSIFIITIIFIIIFFLLLTGSLRCCRMVIIIIIIYVSSPLDVHV